MAAAAGLGLRQGECFGLAVDDVDFLRGVVHVRRQVRIVAERTALARTYFNRHVWKPALDQAGVPATRDNGMHAARHYYASALLEGGVNVRAVAEYLGHNDQASPCASTPTSCHPAKPKPAQPSTARSPTREASGGRWRM
jgi:integrase